MGQLIFHGPAADLGTVELEVVQPERFGGGKAIWTRRRTGQPLTQQVQDRLGPGCGMVAARAAREPVGSPFLGTCAAISGGERIETTAGQAELHCGLTGGQRTLPKGVKHMADKGWGMAMNQLLMIFKDPQDNRRHTTTCLVGHRYARPPQSRVVWPRRFLFCYLHSFSCFARPATVLFCRAGGGAGLLKPPPPSISPNPPGSIPVLDYRPVSPDSIHTAPSAALSVKSACTQTTA